MREYLKKSPSDVTKILDHITLNMHIICSPLIEKWDSHMKNILRELAQVLYMTWEEAA